MHLAHYRIAVAMAHNHVLEGIWLVFLAVWTVGILTSKRATHRESLASELSHRLLLIPAAALVFLRLPGVGLWRPIVPGGGASVVAGDVIAACGIAFAIWARLTLGGNWSGTVTIKEDHQLIRRGPYTLARHPIYTGILFGFLGSAIAMGSVASFVGVLLALLAFKRKSLIEERLMRSQFGEQYARYAQEVRALIPYVW